MHRTSPKRVVAGLTALAVAGASLLVFAPPASAAVTLITPESTPIVLAGGTGQVAGDLTIANNADLDPGDTIILQLLPDGAACTATNPIAFEPTPTVDFDETSAGDLVASLTNTGGCAVMDRLVLTAEGGVVNDGPIGLSGIEYTVGAAASTGPVEVRDVDTGINASNATVAKVDRIEGDTRYDTAARLAGVPETGPVAVEDCAETVVVVDGTNFPDALAAAYLDEPILLVTPTTLPDETEAALDALGTKSVTIIGGDRAVSAEVANAIAALDEGDCGPDVGVGKIGVNRISGETRYQTAREVATEKPAGTFDAGVTGITCAPVKTAILVNGQAPWDALAAGPLAANGAGPAGCGTGSIPLLLTPPNALDAAALEALNTLAIENVIILGGTGAVSQAAEDGLDAAASVANVVRISGATRQATAVALAEVLLDVDFGEFNLGRFLVATGSNFADALVGGPYGGAALAPILLTGTPTQNGSTTLGPDAAGLIEDTVAVLRATLLGGPVALSAAVQTAVGTAFLARN